MSFVVMMSKILHFCDNQFNKGANFIIEIGYVANQNLISYINSTIKTII